MSGAFFAAGTTEVWTAAIFALLAWLVASALELRRGLTRGQRLARVVLLALACLALFLVVARPQRATSTLPGEATLLTPGATASDLATAKARGLPTWAIGGGPGEPAPPAGAVLLPDAAAILRIDRLAPAAGFEPTSPARQAVRRLRVVGHGLAPWELHELGRLPIVATSPPALRFGIARASWPRRLVTGETLEVVGRAVGVPPGGATIRLSGAGIDETSRRLTTGSSGFVLRTTPRGPGRLLLELRLEGPHTAAEVERLDVEVVTATPPAVLWLEGAPSAEGREMKRWLAAAGGALTWRAELTRGRWREEVVGMARTATVAAPSLSLELLRRFDLVIADRRALAALGAGERAALAAAVRESGAGLLLRAGDGAGGEPAALGVTFPLRQAGGGELATRLPLSDGEVAPLALPAREMAARADLVPLTTDRSGRLLGAWRPQGAGAVGATLVEGTWRWVLAGHAADHRRYWRETIAALARPTPASPSWEISPGPLLVGLPATLTFTGENPPASALVQSPDGASLVLPLRQDAVEPRRWTTTLWPRQAGWHQVGEGPAAAWLFWSAPPTQWTAWRLAARQEATAARLVESPAVPTNLPMRGVVPLPRSLFFLLLLLALGALWLHEQLGPTRALPHAVTSAGRRSNGIGSGAESN